MFRFKSSDIAFIIHGYILSGKKKNNALLQIWFWDLIWLNKRPLKFLHATLHSKGQWQNAFYMSPETADDIWAGSVHVCARVVVNACMSSNYGGVRM